MEEQQEEVVYLKVFDKEKGDVLFEGKVSTDVEPCELVKLGCFWDRGLDVIHKKATDEQVNSFKGLQNNVELVAGYGELDAVSGVLYVGADDGVLRKSESVPSCECVMMTAWYLSCEESEKAFKLEMLEELEMFYCGLRQIPREMGKMKNLKKIRLERLYKLKTIPEEIGELSNLEELRIGWGGVESLPRRMKDLKLKSINLTGFYGLRLDAEHLVAFSKLKRLTIQYCSNVFTPSFTQPFWEMIKSTTDLRVLDLEWKMHSSGELVVAALEENGSIVDGGEYAESFSHFFKRNKENHERAMECVVQLLAIRRWRDALNNIPKEMVRMIAMMLWNTKCDVNAWSKKK